MAYVSVPKDLTKVKNKVAFNLTKRQLICIGIGAAMGIPSYDPDRTQYKGLCGTDQFCIPRQKYVPDGKYYRGCLLSADPGTGAYG